MVDYVDLLKMRRSIRDYEDKEVPLDTIRRIITESCLAPSSSNGQPWQFIVVNDREMIKRLSDESKRTLSRISSEPASPAETTRRFCVRKASTSSTTPLPLSS